VGVRNTIGLRVQAKRLFPSGVYASLRPQGGQTSQLIADAGNCYPFFALYNGARHFPAPYPACQCGEYRGPSYCGCLLVSALEVQSRNSNDPADLVSDARPWHCLLCEAGKLGKSDLVEVVADNLRIDLRRDLDERDPVLALASLIGRKPSDRDGSQNYLHERKLAGVVLVQKLEVLNEPRA
jgi:hypothetical protein